MIDYLTYYYKVDTVPFRSLSELPDREAIRIMETLYIQYRDNILFERFQDPAQYLHSRRQTENLVRSAFVKKGGQPSESHPISMVLGSSKWIENNMPDKKLMGKFVSPFLPFQK